MEDNQGDGLKKRPGVLPDYVAIATLFFFANSPGSAIRSYDATYGCLLAVGYLVEALRDQVQGRSV